MKSNRYARMILTGLSMTAMAFSLSGANIWSGGGAADSNIDTPANWDNNLTPALDGSAYVTFGTGGGTATVNTAANFLGIFLNRDANFLFANGAGALTLGAGGLRAVLPSANSRTYTVAEDVTLSADQTWGVTNNGAGAATVIVTGSIDDGASAFGLTKAGSGVLQLGGNNTYDGATLVRTGGVVRITHSSALGSTAAGTTIEKGAYMELSGNIAVAEPLTMSGDAILGYGGTLRSTGGTNTWSGLITIGNDSARVRAYNGSLFYVSGGVTGNLGFVANPDFGCRICFTNNPISIGGQSFNGHGDQAGIVIFSVPSNVWGSLQTVSIIRTDVPNALPPASSFELGAGHNLTGTLDLNGNNQTIGQLRVYAVTNPGVRMVTSATPATLTVNQSANTAVDARFSGAVSLTKTGAGSLSLAGVSTNTGVMTVSGGVLKFTKPAALFNANAAYWSDANIVVNSGGTLGLAVGGAGEFSVADVTALSALASATGGFQNNGLLGLDTTGAPGGVYTFADLIANPPYGNSIGLNKLGTGTLTLTAANTYSGKTVVTAGKLNVADEAVMGVTPASSVADQLVFNGGTLLTTNTFAIDDANRGVTFAAAGGTFETTASTLTVADVIGGSGTLTKAGNGILVLSGVNTNTGKAVLSSGKLSIADETGLGANPAGYAADQLTLNGGTLLGTATFAIDDANRGVTIGASGGTFEIDPSASTVTVAKVISGSGLLSKTGPGTLLLTATNVFSGVTAVTAGTLALGHVDALKFSTLDTGAAGPQGVALTLAGPVTYSIGAIRGSNALDLGANNLNVGVNNQPATYYGAIGGGGGLTKVGTGVFTLAGANSYLGLTTVGSGILQFAAPTALYAGNTASWTADSIVVSNGATLAFNVGGAGEFAASDLDLLKAMGSATGGFKNGSLLGLDTTNAAGGSFTYSSVIANPGGNGLGVHKLGLGTLALTDANAYTGATWLTEGTLSVASITNGGLASAIGASTLAPGNLVFNGGTLKYTGTTTGTDRRITINANKNAIFDVTQAGTTLTFASLSNSLLNGSAAITKNGPGTLTFGYDGPGLMAGNYYATIDAFTINQGNLLSVANDAIQINANRLSPGVAITVADGVTVGVPIPLSNTGDSTEQLFRYVGTNSTATIAYYMGLQGATTAGKPNLKIFDINDGAADTDVLFNYNFSIWPANGVSNVRKDGAGTMRLNGTWAPYMGTTTIRNGRVIVTSSVGSSGVGPLGTNTTALQLGDAGTASNNVLTLAVDGGSYTFARGLYVYPYTNGASALFAGLSTNSLLLSGAVTLSNTLQLASAAAGTNALIVTGLVSGPGGLTSTGAVVLAAANTYTGLTAVASGTLRLAAAERIADASALRLLGGTFATTGFSETLGTLDVDGAATLDFGNGSSVVRFAASAGQTWDGTLTIRNWSGSKEGGGTDQLFVGTSAGGLTAAQLGRIVPLSGYAVRQLSTGEVVMKPNGTLTLVK